MTSYRFVTPYQRKSRTCGAWKIPIISAISLSESCFYSKKHVFFRSPEAVQKLYNDVSDMIREVHRDRGTRGDSREEGERLKWYLLIAVTITLPNIRFQIHFFRIKFENSSSKIIYFSHFLAVWRVKMTSRVHFTRFPVVSSTQNSLEIDLKFSKCGSGNVCRRTLAT